MSPLALLSVVLALSVRGAAAARYRCGIYNGIYQCRRRRSLAGGAIAGIAVAAAVVGLVLLCCILARSRRKMRFRSPGAAAAAPGRHVGFMYFPTAAERKDGLYPVGGAPAMNESGYGSGGPQMSGPQMPVPQTQQPTNYGTSAPMRNQMAEGNLPSPPPAYSGKGETYRPATGNPGAGAYAPPLGPPPVRA